MKIKILNRLETHDRLLEYGKQADTISQGCEDCIKNRPEEFGDLPFYIYAHTRTHDNGYTKRLIWAPRLTKPKAQTNSMLFKCYPPDSIKIVWIIPAEELWDSFKPGQMTHVPFIWNSIFHFKHEKSVMEKREEDDIDDEKASAIYAEIAKNSKYRKLPLN